MILMSSSLGFFQTLEPLQPQLDCMNDLDEHLEMYKSDAFI